MAVVVTVAKGYDLGYVWKNQAQKGGAEQTVGGYYINAAMAGEPPGRWWGPGAQALGFAAGEVVKRGSYDAVYQQRDPVTGEKLGRGRGNYVKFADHLARLKAAEPHATADRVIELEREAAKATRQPAAYTDVTVSFSKSISVLHASIRENARRARLAGDQRAEAYWAGREERFQEILHSANRAALEYMQTWAGVTRTGYHGMRVDGQEPGRFEAAGLIVSSWLQGTSRDGDPQDHIHNQIARITRTFSDGKWRAHDTASLRAVLGALQGIAATAVECELTREFGAMMLLASRLGYVQLAEPVRFTAAWERDASLRLRQGDPTALDDYDQRGRIHAAPPEEAMDQAVKAYVASYLAGHDVILTAADWARCRELSLRVRDELIHLGLVDGGRSVRIGEGAEASVGDLVICRDNDHQIEAGEPGRGLANGDILRIEAIGGNAIQVRRLLEPDPATGQRRFTGRAFCYSGYSSCDLAYAVSGHSAQGGTVHTGITLVTGGEDRQWLYAALTRGTDNNLAFVQTTPVKVADPEPGTRPAPELDRYERARHERDGYLPSQRPALPGAPDPREPIAVLADILDRDGAELSATQTRARNLAGADHLAVLGAIWATETRQAHDTRYRDLVMAALPEEYRQELSHQARWLYRTLRSAELAGLDPAEVARSAIASRDLAGARDIASVIDARIRQRVYPLLPQPQGPWADRIPELPDDQRQAYLAEIAAMMDGRKQRLGEHAAEHAPAWAIKTLGPVPGDGAARRGWVRKAASIGAYREMYGYQHPEDPIGPEPSHDSPDQRAAWSEAFLALGPADGPDVRGMPDGRLWLVRDTYAAETAWAPQHVGRELRLVRLGVANAGLDAIRENAEADAARKQGDHERAGRHEVWAASYRAMRHRYQAQEQLFAQTMNDRIEWERATEHTRRLAAAADAELRRRHPIRKSSRCGPPNPPLPKRPNANS